MSSTEIATPTALTDRLDYARALAPADLLPPAFRNKPANVLLAFEAAAALGKTAMEVIQNGHVINGKLGFSAEFQRALVLESGHRIRVFMEGETAVAQGVRKDDPEFQYEVRWDKDRAKAAGLTSDNWNKHTHSMLKARATTELCRDAFADVIRGFRSVDELAEMEAAPAVAQSKPGDRLRAAVNLPPAPAEDIADAEVVDVSESVEMISDAQMKALHALFNDAAITDRAERLDVCMGVIGRDIDSSKDLTRSEASAVLDRIKALPAEDGA